MAESVSGSHATSDREVARNEEVHSDQNLQSSIEEVWYLKEISFRPDPEAAPKRFKIITQNFNGCVSQHLGLSHS